MANAKAVTKAKTAAKAKAHATAKARAQAAAQAKARAEAAAKAKAAGDAAVRAKTVKAKASKAANEGREGQGGGSRRPRRRPRQKTTPGSAAAAPEPRRFAWAPVEGGVAYHVELFKGWTRCSQRRRRSRSSSSGRPGATRAAGYTSPPERTAGTCGPSPRADAPPRPSSRRSYRSRSPLVPPSAGGLSRGRSPPMNRTMASAALTIDDQSDISPELVLVDPELLAACATACAPALSPSAPAASVAQSSSGCLTPQGFDVRRWRPSGLTPTRS